jgi:propanol-preferring alcohol dehydrogenase
MRAARFHGENDLRVEDAGTPEPAADEVHVDLKAASICGSDINYLKGKTEPADRPLTLGHEGAGVVAGTGSEIESVETGDRVAIHYIRSCGTCRPCSRGHDNRCRSRQSIGHHVDGTFAESIVVPERSVVSLPEAVPFSWGAIAGCAVSTAYHALDRANMRAGDVVTIFGTGGVGQHAVLWADSLGASKTIAVDPLDHQLAAAADYGADVTLDPSCDDVSSRVPEETDGWGCDVAIECSGSPAAMEQAIEAINGRNGYESGTVVSVGIQTEEISVGFGDVREGALLVSGDHQRGDLEEVLRLLETHVIDIGPSVTHEVDLENIHEGVDLMLDRNERIGRVVVDTD